MMRKILTRFAAALLFTTSLVAAVAPAAPAAASVPCPQNVVCTYWDTNYGGAMYYYSSPYYQCIEVGEPWDNDISSAFNRTSVTIYFYHGHGCFGEVDFLAPFCNCVWDKDPNFGSPENANDVISSLRIG